jgi:hypothetical protein
MSELEAMSSDYGAVKEVTPERVQDASAELHQRLDALTESVNVLFDRLQPVLRDTDVPAYLSKSMTSYPMSDVQTVVRNAIDTVNTLTERVDSVRFRLDI